MELGGLCYETMAGLAPRQPIKTNSNSVLLRLQRNAKSGAL